MDLHLLFTMSEKTTSIPVVSFFFGELHSFIKSAMYDGPEGDEERKTLNRKSNCSSKVIIWSQIFWENWTWVVTVLNVSICVIPYKTEMIIWF